MTARRQVLRYTPIEDPEESFPYPPPEPSQLIRVREPLPQVAVEANAIDGYYAALERMPPVLDALVAQVTAFRDYVCSEENVAKQATGVLTAVGTLDRVADAGRRVLEETRRAQAEVQGVTS